MLDGVATGASYHKKMMKRDEQTDKRTGGKDTRHITDIVTSIYRHGNSLTQRPLGNRPIDASSVTASRPFMNTKTKTTAITLKHCCIVVVVVKIKGNSLSATGRHLPHGITQCYLARLADRLVLNLRVPGG